MIPIKEMLKRDNHIPDNLLKYYQVQVSETNDVNITHVGNFEESNIPIQKILKIKLDNYLCTLCSYLISENEIENDHYKMIGFVITDEEDTIVAMIDFMHDKKNTEEPYFIRFEKENKIEILKTFKKYIGREKSIYILSETLGEKNVIESLN